MNVPPIYQTVSVESLKKPAPAKFEREWNELSIASDIDRAIVVPRQKAGGMMSSLRARAKRIKKRVSSKKINERETAIWLE